VKKIPFLSFLIGLAICSSTVLTFSQTINNQTLTSWTKIDQHALAAPKKVQDDLPKLYEYLIQNCKTPTEKVRSFYTWIVHNIEYDRKALDLKSARINRDLGGILQRKKAVCVGYSQLLEALCDKANIPNEIISGYTRIEGEPLQLEAPDHTWNAVFLNGQWQLLEPTWASNYAQHGDKKIQKRKEDFFLTKPLHFLREHLPNDPIWQLTDCPISLDDFRQNVVNDKNWSSDSTQCINYRDSIYAFRQMNVPNKKIHLAKAAYQYNPSKANGKELGNTYMDHFLVLSEKEDNLQEEKDVNALLDIQSKMFELAEKAQTFDQLFDWQKDYLARTHLNHAVALYQQLDELEDVKDREAQLKKMRHHFIQCQKLFREIKPHFFTEHAIQQCDEYLEFVTEALENLVK